MQTFNDKKAIELTLLWEITRTLYGNITPQELSISLNNIFGTFLKISSLKLWIHDENTESIRDFSKNWHIIDQKQEQESLFKTINKLSSVNGQGFIINNRLMLFELKENEILEKIRLTRNNTIFIPITDKDKVIGLIEIIMPELSPDFASLDFLMCINIAAVQISTAIMNMKLREHMELNISFHQAMRNMAKIIESQYELSYIVPLIGEMMDKFIQDHLIYIFNIDNNAEFQLLWPAAYSKAKLDPLLEKIKDKTTYILSEDKFTGVFPLMAENKLSGAVIAVGNTNKLNEKEINYLEELTRQAAITIDKANCYAEILQHATIDALTGLNNRRQLEQRLTQEISMARRKKNHLCCLMMDVDHFKSINDTYGHLAGDLTLHDIARIIREELRTYDVAGRYGGEEFCIMLPDTNLEKARLIADRLRKRIEKTKFDISSINPVIKKITTTISIGITKFKPEIHIDNKNLYEEADKALYQAKREGRNRVVVFDYL